MKGLLIAITGGIGSGKSTALNFLKEKGYPVISCDEITKKLYKSHRVKNGLKKIFPTGVKGKIFLKADKKEIAEIAFNDKRKNSELTNYFTPIIFNKCKKTAQKLCAFNNKVFVEVPLLFEMGYQNEFDKIIVINRDKKDRIESVKQRSNLTENQVVERINNQIDYDNFDFGDNKNIIYIKNNNDLNSWTSELQKEIDKL